MSAEKATSAMGEPREPETASREFEADITPIDDAEGGKQAAGDGSRDEAPPADPRRDEGAEAAPPAAEPPAEEAPPGERDELDTLRGERDRLYDAWLRATADFDNFRKRVDRERDEFRQYAVESLIVQLLPVLDNFERALESLPAELQRGFREGVGLIHKQLSDALARQGVTPIVTAGELFDPHLHEAVETETRTDVPHHSILSERQKGYRLGKRILRPARVRVSVRPDEGANAPEGGEESTEAIPEDRV